MSSMAQADAVDATAVEEPAMGTDVAVVDGHGYGIIRAEQPQDILVKATQIADALKGLIDKQGLAVNVGTRQKPKMHVEVGAWQACGTMLGALGGQALHAETVWTRPVLADDGVTHKRTRYTATVKRYYKKADGGGLREETTYDVDGLDWEARVEVRTPDGVIVGSAEAMVSRTEETWNRRDDYALRSMSETRAESRAYRRAIGWIVQLAGYNATPAEEMGHTPGADTSPADPERPFGVKLDSDKAPAVLAAIQSLLGVDDAKAREVATAIGTLAGGYMPAIVGDALLAITAALGDSTPAPAGATAAKPPPHTDQVSDATVQRALRALLDAEDEHWVKRRKADARMVALGASQRQRLQELQASDKLDVLIARVDKAVASAIQQALALDDGLGTLRSVVETGMRALGREPHEILAALRKAQDQAALEAAVTELQAAHAKPSETAGSAA